MNNFMMTRSAAEFWSKQLNQPFTWGKDISHYVNGRYVTYTELLELRKKRQAEHLKQVTEPEPPARRAAQIWVFHVSGFFYGGWHLYLRVIGKDEWLKNHNSLLVMSIIRAFPCGFLPEIADMAGTTNLG